MIPKPKVARSDLDLPFPTPRPSNSRRASAMAVVDTSKRQKGSKKVQARAAHPEPATDVVRITPGDYTAYTLIARDEQGNVRVQSSDEVKGYLDETTLSNHFQQAYERSRTEYASTSRPGALVAEVEEDSEAEDSMTHTIAAPGKPVAKSSSRRMLQPVKQRGRQLAPGPSLASMHQTPPETPVESAAASPEEDRHPPMPSYTQTKSFRIDDADAVAEFLMDRLKRMQQLADKKIAKCWIKGICPKKQARFPYQNNRQEKETGIKPEIPGWWPDVVNVCRFIEPDHIRREERMGLCLHLLRLRPTPAQLEQWNRSDTPSSKTHQLHGWTAWLKELAGHEIFEDLPREPGYRTQHRRELMTQMYEAAQMEEDYLNEAIDGDEMFIYQEYDENLRPPIPVNAAKRSRSPSAVSLPEREEPTTRSASSSCSRASAKRARRDSRPSTAQNTERRASDCDSDLEMTDEQPGVPRVVDQDAAGASFERKTETVARHSIPMDSSFEGKIESAPRHSITIDPSNLAVVPAQPPHHSPVNLQYHAHGLPVQGNWRSYDQFAEWQDSSMSARAEHPGGSHIQYQAPNTFPGRQNFEFPQYQPVQQTYMSHIPQPEYQTVPNTPAFSSAPLASMPMDPYPMQPTSMAHDQHYALSMAPASFFTSAHADSTDFHRPTNMGSNMQNLQTQGMMPFLQPDPWLQPQQPRHQ